MPTPPEHSPLVSEVISAAMKREVTEADVLVRCPTCATTVTMHTADVDLTEHGSRYYCPNGCDPATLLLHVEAQGARWDVVAPHGYALAIKPTANPGRSATRRSP